MSSELAQDVATVAAVAANADDVAASSTTPNGKTTSPPWYGSLAANPMFSAGAGIAGLGALYGILRGSAKAGMNLVQRHYTISLEIPSKDKSFQWLLQYLTKQARSNSSGALSQHIGVDTSYSVGKDGSVQTQFEFVPSTGTHGLWYRNRYIHIKREREKSMIDMQTGSPWETVTLRTYGRDRSLFIDLLNEARQSALQKTEGKTIIYTCDGISWKPFGTPRKRRPFHSVILDKGVSEMILADFQDFIESQQWYIDRGIPYRRGYLLYGPPGCGKSSYIIALAGHCAYNICILNMAERGMTDDKLAFMLATAPPRSIILLEDIDAAFTNGTTSTVSGIAREASKSHNSMGVYVTFSGLLNALDGVASTEERIIFMTTNFIDRLDNALIRPGRVDTRVFIGFASEHQQRLMFQRFYPNATTRESDEFVAMLNGVHVSIADLQGLFLVCKGDSARAIFLANEMKTNKLSSSTHALPSASYIMSR